MVSPEAELAGRFWDLANNVAAFASLQMVAFLLAFMTFSAERRRALREERWRVLGFIIVVNLVFVGAIWTCYSIERSLRIAEGQHVIVLLKSGWAAALRTAWIAAFALLGCLAVWREILPRLR